MATNNNRSRRSSATPQLVSTLALCAAALGSGCDTQIPSEHGLTSLRITLQTPKETELGTPSQSVQPTSMRFDVDALDEKGDLMPMTGQVEAFLVAGGTRLSLRDPCNSNPGPTVGPDYLLGYIALKDGKASGVNLRIDSPIIFGRATLNIEDPVTRAVGATPPIYFFNPTLPQLTTPFDKAALNATYCSAYLGRQVVLDHGTARPAGAQGKLVVSSVFQNGLAVSDSGADEYNSVYVFTFSRPSTNVVRGRLVTRLSGAVAKFNGMTQIANPTITTADGIEPTAVPKYVELDAARRPVQDPTDSKNQWLGSHIAAPVRITGIVCEAEKDQTRSDNWAKYNTVVINQTDMDPESSGGCGGVNPTGYVAPTRFSVQFPGKGVNGFDPVPHKGKEVTLTGMLQNSVSKSGKTLFWTVVVRDASDVCIGPRATCQNAQ